MNSIKSFSKIFCIAVLIGILAGVVCYLFSRGLDFVTTLRRSYGIYPYFILPFIGAFVAYLYSLFGKAVEEGNNLVLDEIHTPKAKIPFRMVPMIFFSALSSHLFGASVGREGVGVQIGAGIADSFSHFKIDRKLILMMGISAGFAGIFNAPFAGTIFGAEVILVGSISYFALLPCFISGIAAFLVNIYFEGVTPRYAFVELPGHFDFKIFLSVILLGIIFGITARFFSFSLHFTKNIFHKLISQKMLRPFVGGLLLLGLFLLVGNDRYHGLGKEVLEGAFTEKLLPYDFLGKILSTSLSIGSGFKGGEVMSLFYVGATLGNVLSPIFSLAPSFLAALGFVSVFSGAANTPITALILAVEYFGIEIGLYAGIAVVISFLFSGNKGIFENQRKKFIKKF
jgi:H+/Cl- antiporter ClcA